MKIFASKQISSTKDMAASLANEFKDKYSFKLFGLGKQKSILVRKSMFVGAQISHNQEEIVIEAAHPNVFASFISSILSFLVVGFAAPMSHLWGQEASSPWGKLEQELAVFLEKKYN